MQLYRIGIKMSFLILAAKICLYSSANIRIVSGKFCPAAGGWERKPPPDIIGSKGMAFVPFSPEDGYRFCPPDYGLKSGIVFKGTTRVYEPGIFTCNMFSVKYYNMIIQNSETIH